MKELGINNKDCKNETIKKFFKLINSMHSFLKDNLKLIQQEDIKQFLEKGYNVINQINNL